TVPSDWDLANIDCRPNNNTGLTDGLTIVLEAGEEAVCTFNNVHTPPPPPKASITIVKSVNWNGVPVDGSQTFDLCINSVAFSSPQCQTVGANGGSVSFADLDLGVYDVYELDPGSDWTVSGGTSVTLDTPDQQASVTITNTRNIVVLPLTLEAVCPAGTIIVTNPNGFPVDFQYNGQSYSVGANSTTQITAQPGETVTITFNGGNATITAKLTTDCGTVSQEPGLTCPANWTLIGESRAVLGINHPNVVFEVNYNFNLDGAFQDYQVAVLVASAVGHPEAGCLIGGGNDGGTYPCDQGQNYESFNVLFDGGQVASIPDHGEDQWQSFGNVYSATIGAGAHTVTYRHIGQGTTPESVTYKSIICVLAGQPVVTQAAPVESQAVTQPEQAPPPQEKEEEVPPVEEQPTEGEQPAEVEEPVQGDESAGGEGEGAQPTDTPDKSGDESAEG
ncbi:MAG: hypothetical protein KC615_18930, partial [Anaerolineae bacterium]|nr:hypothetical protein [Anaerolineae bacterium]